MSCLPTNSRRSRFSIDCECKFEAAFHFCVVGEEGENEDTAGVAADDSLEETTTSDAREASPVPTVTDEHPEVGVDLFV